MAKNDVNVIEKRRLAGLGEGEKIYFPSLIKDKSFGLYVFQTRCIYGLFLTHVNKRIGEKSNLYE